MNEDVIFSLRNVSFEYSGRGNSPSIPALRGITVEIQRGELIAVAGANASGKTTLALILAGIFHPTSGDIAYKGELLRGEDHPFDGVSMIFQNPENTFVAPTLAEDVAFGPENACLDPSAIRHRVDESLMKVGLDRYAGRHPATLSGGQQQLAALAGALACNPDVLILDEATGYLDSTHRLRVMDLVHEMNVSRMVTVVMVSQDVEELWAADRLAVICEGKIAYLGPPGEILMNPGECRCLGIEADPLVELVSCLKSRGVAIPRGRPTPEMIEASLAYRNT